MASGSPPAEQPYHLSHRWVFGGDFRNKTGVHYAGGDDSHVVYVAGKTLILYNCEQRKQTFLPGTPGFNEFTALALSGNKK